MSKACELVIEVTNSPHLQEPARIGATITWPESGLESVAGQPPIVCFAKPAGSYSRGYFTCDLPGPARGAQADWHAARGWIFVSLDNLGAGDSSRHEAERMDFAAVSHVSFVAEQEILLRLANGTIAPDLPPIIQPVKIGLGHSFGACMTIVQQAQYGCYDGIAVLGFSPLHSHPPSPPGEPAIVVPWFARDLAVDMPGAILNRSAVDGAASRDDAAWAALAWGSYYDDVPDSVVQLDLAHYEVLAARLAPADGRSDLAWASSGTSGKAGRLVLTPGMVAPEAAAITVPVLAAMGERDMVVDPGGEARAYRSTPSFELFICPRMGHIHNFASTREALWQKIENFGQWCRIHSGI